MSSSTDSGGMPNLADSPGLDRSLASTPIEDHGLIGNLSTGALVTKSGSIDFLCVPHFSGPTIFCRLLDPEAGHFTIVPDGTFRESQLYLPDTAVLLSRFMSEQAIGELTDFMPVRTGAGYTCILRRFSVVRGSFTVRLRCGPRFNYARTEHRVMRDGEAVVFHAEGFPPIRLRGSVPIEIDGDDATACLVLQSKEAASFILEIGDGSSSRDRLSDDAYAQEYAATVAWWHQWTGGARYTGRWREMVVRSAITLKVLTCEEQGAPVAALTFGLPEKPQGRDNWDYRYCWVRDASFTMYALMRLGLTGEAETFVGWIGARMREDKDEDVPLRIMYSLDGKASAEELEERTLDHFAGWNGARPVLIGNAAATQVQLDIFGELMDAIYLANKYSAASTYEEWGDVCRIVEWVSAHWRDKDSGIWEIRGATKNYLHSRLMCWVAVDRAMRLADKRSLPAPMLEWNTTRNEIHASIHTEFWSDTLARFTNTPDSETVDASMLLMPLVRFISPRDPRWLSTLRAIGEDLSQDVLVFRFPKPDQDVWGETDSPREGSFLACSFWYVEALARAGEIAEARLLFEKLLGYANHLGLYAEELTPGGRQLGNFPQALTHLALISAANYLDRALTGHAPTVWG